MIVQFKIGLQAFAWISALPGKLDASGRGVFVCGSFYLNTGCDVKLIGTHGEYDAIGTETVIWALYEKLCISVGCLIRSCPVFDAGGSCRR